MLLLDEQARRNARQELLEAIVRGSQFGPMPDALIEMLELAAMERRAIDLAQSSDTPGLTPIGNATPMRKASVAKAIVDGAARLIAHLAAWRMQVRPRPRASAP